MRGQSLMTFSASLINIFAYSRNSGRKDQEMETPVVWTCGVDVGGKTTNRSFTWTCGGKEKQREAEEYNAIQYNFRLMQATHN